MRLPSVYALGVLLLLGILTVPPVVHAFDPSGDPCRHFDPPDMKKLPADQQLTQSDRDELLEEADWTFQDLARFRGLPVKGKVAKAFKDKAFFKKYFQDDLDREYPKDKRKGFRDAQVWLGLLSPDSDWLDKAAEEQVKHIVGLYDPPTKTFYIGDWVPADLIREVMVHEMVHALQDQNFNLQGFVESGRNKDRDTQTAHQSLWEGEAVALTWQYQRSTGEDPGIRKDDDFKTWIKEKREIDNGRLRLWGCPGHYWEYLTFPYVQGAIFVDEVAEKNGWKAVDQLWSHPPQSTMAILDENHQAASPVQIRIPDIPGDPLKDMKKVWSDTLGAYGLMVYLMPHWGEKSAREAIRGWRGDRFDFWEGGGGANSKALIGHVQLETEEEASEFFKAFAFSQSRRFKFEKVLESDDHVQWLKMSDENESSTYVEWMDRDVWVIEGLDLSQTSAVREILLN